MDARTTICNMAVEMSARTGIMPYDEPLAAYLKGRAQWPAEPIESDPDARYADRMTIDLSTLEPTIAFPHKPANTTPISRVQDMLAHSQQSPSPDFPAVTSDKITDAFLGACTNGRYEDIKLAAEVIAGRKVHRDVRLIVIPSSLEGYRRCIAEGLDEVFVEAGGVFSTPTCGPCLGGHMGVLAEGERALATTNRNVVGRMGHPKSEVYLCGPAVAAASAVAGKILHPDELKADTGCIL
jgi:3-isopropylmalate/(R)-2-methylmalate dehydratase large subunit